jgi:hypothetical protein
MKKEIKYMYSAIYIPYKLLITLLYITILSLTYNLLTYNKIFHKFTSTELLKRKGSFYSFKSYKMKYKKQCLINIFILAFSISAICQNSAVTAGGNVNNENGSISFSIGQLVVTTYNGDNNSLSHGVQQPFEISEITGIYSDNNVRIDISIYPNPTENEIHIKFNDHLAINDNVFLQLFDSKGNLIISQKVYGIKSTLTIEALVSGTYLLRINQISESLSPKIIKTFKIIKN